MHVSKIQDRYWHFLTSRTVLQRAAHLVASDIEEFEPWYALWPDFDNKTRIALADEEYKYMLFSDISGYFENISLPVLRDLLFILVTEAPNTINLLMTHLYAWCRPSYDGASTQRGIPQGNAVSSFLGNIFLKPVDDFFDLYSDKDKLLYFRYMDDIRIVAKTREDARQAALALEEHIRKCQLNLQSSKTKLVTDVDALKLITDRRLEKLDELLPAYKDKKVDRTALLAELDLIARDKGDCAGGKSIRSARALDGLNLRVLPIPGGCSMNDKAKDTVSADTEFNWVTSQIAAHRAMAMPAFALYIQTFAAIVGGSIWISFQKDIGGPSAKYRYALLTDVAAIVLAIAVSVLLWESWRGWRSYRQAHSELMPHVNPPTTFPAGAIWFVMIAAMTVATAVFCRFNPFFF